ncbi:hypothetical protein CsSME_00017944 [Camellia sinensis var. sinensis]
MGPKTQEENEKMARVPYANAVGSLMYAMMCTRPDICYAVGLGGDLDERKSTSGYAFMLSDGAISWSSKKQSCIALSTMEADMAAFAYAKDPKYHGRTKHIDVRFNFIRDILAQKEVILEHIPTSRMVADPLTKPIARDVYFTHVRALGLRSITLWKSNSTITCIHIACSYRPVSEVKE